MGATPINAVRQVQDICGAKSDGLIGPKTIAALKRWQSKHKLKADGLYGPKTKKKMEQVTGRELDLWRWYYPGLGEDSPQPLFVDLAYYQAGWGWHSSGTVHISAPDPEDRPGVIASIPGLYESRGTTDSINGYDAAGLSVGYLQYTVHSSNVGFLMADMAENAPEELDQWFGTYNIGLQRDGSRWLITINGEVMNLVEFRDLEITRIFQVCCAFSEGMQAAQERAGIERLRRTLKILKIPKSSLECWKSICFDIGCNRGIRGVSRLIRGSGAANEPDDREKCKRLARFFLAKYLSNPDRRARWLHRLQYSTHGAPLLDGHKVDLSGLA